MPGTFGLSVAQTLFAGAGITWVCLNVTGFSGPIRERITLITVLAYVTTSFLSFGASMMRGVPHVAQVALDRYILGDLYILGTVLFTSTAGILSSALDDRGLPAAQRDEVVAAVVFDPAKDELFTAEKGDGAFVNDKRLRVSGRRDMNSAIFATGVPFGTANKGLSA